jgi:hypothetical protein
MLPGILSALLWMSVPQIEPATPEGQLQDQVRDPGSVAFPAIVRVIHQDTNTVVLRFRAKENGTFETGRLAPSVYSLSVFAQGFRRREL